MISVYPSVGRELLLMLLVAEASIDPSAILNRGRILVVVGTADSSLKAFGHPLMFALRFR